MRQKVIAEKVTADDIITFPLELLILLMSLLGYKDALSLALANKLFYKIFSEVYIPHFLGFEIKDLKLDKKTLQEMLYAKKRLPHSISNYNEFTQILDIESTLHSINNSEKGLSETKQIIANLKTKYSFLNEDNKKALCTWQLYYCYLLQNTNLLENLNRLSSLYKSYQENNYPEDISTKLVVNYLYLFHKIFGFSYEYVALFQMNSAYLHILKDKPELKNLSAFLHNCFTQLQPNNLSTFLEQLFKSGLRNQYILEILRSKFALFLSYEQAEIEQTNWPVLIQWFREFATLLTPNSELYKRFTASIHNKNSKLIIPNINALADKSDLEIGLFITDLFVMSDLTQNICTYFGFQSTPKIALKNLLHFYHKIAPESKEAIQLRSKINDTYANILQITLQFTNTSLEKRKIVSPNTLKEEGKKLYPFWKEIQQWFLATLQYNPEIILELAKIYALTVGYDSYYTHIPECKEKKISSFDIALNYFNEYLKLEHVDASKKLYCFGQIAELYLKKEQGDGKDVYTESISRFYHFLQETKSELAQIYSELTPSTFIHKIAYILVLLSDKNNQDKINKELAFILKHEMGRKIVDNFCKTELAQKTGFADLLYSNSDMKTFELKFTSAIEIINTQSGILRSLFDDLYTLKNRLTANDRITNLQQMKDVEESLATSNKSLLTAASKITEIGNKSEAQFKNLKCFGFFNQPQAKKDSKEEENSNQNSTSTKSKKEPARKKRKM